MTDMDELGEMDEAGEAGVEPVSRGPRVRVVESVQHVGHYVRETNPIEMKNDLVNEIREHPVRSIAVALVSGFLLAKIID